MPDYSGLSIGRYHIIEPLGQGGMATVYRAFDTRLDCDVAIKFIRMERLTGEEKEKALKRFEREAKELARLTHPNIVKVTDFGKFRGAPYLVMEYLPGGTLKSLAGKPLPYDQAAHLVAPVARALEYAHEENIVHRDIKPGNILLTSRGQPMLSDFGIAKILDVEGGHTLTSTNVAIGTPEYMAPEQWLNQVSAQSDIYALGVVFYELVTGQRPYTADTPAAIFLKQSTDPLPRPHSFVPGLPEEVEQVLYKALAKKSEERYASMGEFAVALEGLANPYRPAQSPQPEILEPAFIHPQAPGPGNHASQPEILSTEKYWPGAPGGEVIPQTLPPKKAQAKSTPHRRIPAGIQAIILIGLVALIGWGVNKYISVPKMLQIAQGVLKLPVGSAPTQTETSAANTTPVATLTPIQGIG
jgi:serine/threonine protein kinase